MSAHRPQIVAAGPSPAAMAPVGVKEPSHLLGQQLPDDYDYTRAYVIPGCTTVELERYEFPAGPANPNSRSLADVVKAWAG